MILQSLELSHLIGLANFFLIGLYVALSPCLFPIMPMTIFRIMNTNMKDSEGNSGSPSRIMVLRWVIILVSGIFVVFSVLGFIAVFIWTGLGLELINLNRQFSLLMGVILMIIGIFIIFPQLSERTFAKIPIPQGVSNIMIREEYKQLDLFIMGLGYSIIAFPCAAPAFLTLLGTSVVVSTFLDLLIGMIVFGIGLFIPYLILVFVTAETRTRVASQLAGNFRKVEIVLGSLIILFGLLFLLFGLSILSIFPTFLPF